ncbi:MAG TPA: hypothetical protein VMV48_07405 [Gallionellaceae bacterium]|nr:hypothetical protein [Gallionellaceae bacterium]
MYIQNISYALTQVVHNFGASAVLGGAVAALWLAPRPELERALGWLVLSGWAAQIASGAAFGVISFYYYEQFPDISFAGTVALVIKLACAASGFSLAAFYLLYARGKPQAWRRCIWMIMTVLGGTALTAAAFLRWYS